MGTPAARRLPPALASARAASAASCADASKLAFSFARMAWKAGAVLRSSAMGCCARVRFEALAK